MKKNNSIQMPNHPFKTAQDVKRYVRDILLQVQQEETLKKIIDITSKIDYAVIYHLDDDEALTRLYKLREKKKTGGLSEEEWKELWSLEPDDEIKYIILIEELLGNADVFNLGLGIEPDTLLPYIYTGCHWKNVSRPLLKEFLAVAANKADFNYYDIRLNRNIEKLYNQFVSLCTLVPNLNEKQDEVKINLQNGTFVISKEKKELRDFDKKDFFKYQLPFKYNPEAKCDEFKVFLNQVLPEKESQMIFAEYLGYIFINNLKLEKCLILKGEGSNGKSVIFEIVQALLGEHNTCSYTISNLCNENGYFRAQLGNYLLNYSSELGGKNINPDLLYISDMYYAHYCNELATQISISSGWKYNMKSLTYYQHASIKPNDTGGYVDIEEKTYNEIVSAKHEQAKSIALLFYTGICAEDGKLTSRNIESLFKILQYECRYNYKETRKRVLNFKSYK